MAPSPQPAASSPFGFTGQRLDASTGLYFFHARYYDPELGRFLQPDTIVQAPGDPQTLNRYTYANNNPLNNVDPSGHGWFSKIFGWVSAALSFLLPPLAPFLTLANLGLGIYHAAQTGNWLGVVGSTLGSFAGGAVFGSIGQGVGLGMATSIGGSAYTFLGGAISGAAEFAIGGFGAGFGSALASGASFRESFKVGGQGAAFGAVVGAGIQGSYMAGWQDSLHGFSVGQLAQQGVLPPPGDLAGTGAGTRARGRSGWGRYLHGTDAASAAAIRASPFGLRPGSYVTLPEAMDSVTGKIALKLNPAEFRQFVSQPRPGVGDWFVDVLAPKKSVVPLPPTLGGAPQFRIYGQHAIPAVHPNEN